GGRGAPSAPPPAPARGRPPMGSRPRAGCASPATQRGVVVFPQPDGPSRTTISPAGTTKLTPSTAGRPAPNAFTRSRTSSVAAILSLLSVLRHCERSEAISFRLRMTRGGDCFVAHRSRVYPRSAIYNTQVGQARLACAPRNDAEGHCL